MRYERGLKVTSNFLEGRCAKCRSLTLLKLMATSGCLNPPDDKIWGILRISESGESSLEVFGTFHDPFLERQPGSQIGRLHILGLIDRHGGPVTLCDCIPVEVTTTENAGSLSKSKIYVGRAFLGSHLDEEDIAFSGVVFRIEGLTEWFDSYLRAFSTDYKSDGQVSVIYKPRALISFGIPENAEVSFGMRMSQSSGMFRYHMATGMSVSVEFRDLTPFDEIMTVVTRIKNFLRLAIDRPVSFTSIVGHREASTDSTSIEVYGKFDSYAQQKQEIHVGGGLFSYGDVGANLERFLKYMARPL